MPVNPAIMRQPVTKTDVAIVALSASSAVHNIRWALRALSKGENIDEYLKQIEEDAKKLGEMFDELTGWTAE